MRALRARGLARARRHFRRRLRRLRMGGLFRAAADAGRAALRRDRPARRRPSDGADRRARRRRRGRSGSTRRSSSAIPAGRRDERATDACRPLLEMRGVVKSFGGAQALRGVDFDLKRGEVHALLGENGAGKSTLMNMLSGVIAPDAGEMAIDGEPVRFGDPRAAQAAGVATIFQELDLVPSLDVTANLFLGRELTRAGVLDRGDDAPRGARADRSDRRRHRRRSARRRIVGRPAADRRHRQGADLRLADPGHGRADGGADRGRGRATVRADARASPRAASASSTSRIGSRRCRASPTASRCCATAGSPASLRRARRNRNSFRLLVGRPLDRTLSRAARRVRRRVLRLERARFPPARARRAGRRRATSRSRCAPARSSASPASWAPAAPSC